MGASLQPLDPRTHKTSSKNPGCFVSKAVCAWLAGGFLSLALLHLLCCYPAATQRAALSPLLQYINNTYSFVSTVPGRRAEESRGGPPVEEEEEEEMRSCNYAVGSWVWAPGHARRYNATECNAKESHDCIRNGRPDTAYLDWRWQPADGCPLPAFDAAAFLSAVRGKHVAFVGDSMARNQAQSLVCLLSSAFPFRLVYRDEGQHKHNFWRYAFPAHDVTVSFYWAPFLLRATGKAEDLTVWDNHVHLDALGDRWAADADTIDVAVLAAAHWLLNGAIYYNGSQIVGEHGHPELNVSRVGYAWPLRVGYRAAVERLTSGTAAGGRPRTVVLATFSPSHFEGKASDDPAACNRTEPYREGENDMEWMYREVRDIVYDEANAARARSGGGGGATRIEVLDVSKLASMRPDGHPGLYMHDHPFANGPVPAGTTNDCLHFCLPGPVDTFNEILLQILRKRRR